MEEIWKDIKDYEGVYQVSNFGNVKSFKKKEHILKKWKRSSYFLVDLWKNGKRDIRSIHHLVYETFNNRQTGGFLVHHKDENKYNNCVDNLELMTYQEHNQHHFCGKAGWKKGLKINNLQKKYNRLSPESYKLMWETRHKTIIPRNKEIIRLAGLGKRVADLAEQFGICSRQIQQIIKEKERWMLMK